jgi:hypothetical protein
MESQSTLENSMGFHSLGRPGIVPGTYAIIVVVFVLAILHLHLTLYTSLAHEVQCAQLFAPISNGKVMTGIGVV